MINALCQVMIVATVSGHTTTLEQRLVNCVATKPQVHLVSFFAEKRRRVLEADRIRIHNMKIKGNG